MGQNIQAISEALVGEATLFIKEAHILMLGLDTTGKTTILYKMKLGEVVSAVPTIGFNVQFVNRKNMKYTIWDVGGQKNIRPLWRHYYENKNILFFVIDSTNQDNIKESKKYLNEILEDENTTNIPILVLANKRDLPNCKSIPEIVEILQMHKLRKREWKVQGCSAASGQGLDEALDWATQLIKKKHKK